MIELVFAIVVIAIGILSLPMMSDVTTTGSAQNLEADEAIFEAYIKAVEATDETFAKLKSSTGLSSVVSGGAGQLSGLKFDHKYRIDVSSPATFGSDTNSNDIKKVVVTVTDAGGNVITRLTTYKFRF